jgi:cytochrome c-type biogenesis protein CcmE
VARSSPARLVIALAIAACLAVFLLYTSFFGSGTPSLQPSELVGQNGQVSLSGRVASRPQENAAGTARFRLRDINGAGAVTVVYRDALPDQFKVGRDISVDGRLRNGVFVGTPGTMVTKCPSKYTDKPASA